MSSLTTKLTTSGNSKAVVLPKDLLAMSKLGDVVQLEARRGLITIRPATNPRAGWQEMIEKEIKAGGPPTGVDSYGDMGLEREATIAEGINPEAW